MTTARNAHRPRRDAPVEGSTPLSQQLDAEEWRDLISRYQRAATETVEKFGGHVAKNLGDGLPIHFGWPTAREDDPGRTIRAGLAIVDTMGTLNATLAGTQLAVRVGLHTGKVAAGAYFFSDPEGNDLEIYSPAQAAAAAATPATPPARP